MSDKGADSPREASADTARWRRRFVILLMLLLVPIALGISVGSRFLVDRPVTYDGIEEHFKYGSTGGERVSGFPFWIWQVLPKVCGKYLPGEGYASLGLIYEPGKVLPVGMSMRRNLGLDRVFLNCAACHAGTVRDTPDSVPRVMGMPAHTLNLMAFENFFFQCAGDAKFSADHIVPEIDRQAGRLGMLDRYLVYPVAIALMRERLLMLRERFAWSLEQPEWGPAASTLSIPRRRCSTFRRTSSHRARASARRIFRRSGSSASANSETMASRCSCIGTATTPNRRSATRMPPLVPARHRPP